ncbi:MAG: ABC transporter permease [Actinomycetota bacterium]|nr:ABC transporter permease [Actinomycetota bacterium]
MEETEVLSGAGVVKEKLARLAVGTYIVWLRDLKNFWRDTMRRIGAIVQPLIYLFLLGTGLEAAFQVFGGGDTEYVTFMYPGIVAMTVLFTSMFSAISIIWDREFGFLKEMMVAPMPRSSLALGKVLGGATTALLQGIILLVLMPLVGIPYTLEKIFLMLLVMIVISLGLTSMGVLIASRMRSFEGFPIVMNFILLPMFFLSGAMFPLQDLPGWMDVLTKVNPMTYGVDALRGAALKGIEITSTSALQIPPDLMAKLTEAGVQMPQTPMLQNQVYPLWMSLVIVTGFGLLMLFLAVWRFSRQE